MTFNSLYVIIPIQISSRFISSYQHQYTLMFEKRIYKFFKDENCSQINMVLNFFKYDLECKSHYCLEQPHFTQLKLFQRLNHVITITIQTLFLMIRRLPHWQHSKTHMMASFVKLNCDASFKQYIVGTGVIARKSTGLLLVCFGEV